MRKGSMSTKVMLAGLNANTERLAKRGITAEFIAKLNGTYSAAMTDFVNLKDS